MVRSAFLAATAILALPAASAAGADQRVTVRDPAGGSAWRGSLSASGAKACIFVSRRGDRRARGRFCGPIGRDAAYVYGVYHRTTKSRPRRWRTVYVVGFHRSVVRARLSVPGRTVRYRRRRGRPRILMVVVRGFTERGELRADVAVGGRTVRLVTRPRGVQTADPGGGAAWRVVPDRLDRGAEGCVHWERVPPRFAPVPEPERGDGSCARASDRLGIVAAEQIGKLDRTVVTGLVGEDVRAVRVRAAGAERPAALDPDSGAFIAVLPSVAPDEVDVVLTLADGNEVVQPLGSSG